MKEIKVLLAACHGYSHFGSYSSHDTVDLEVSDEALAALRKIHPSEASCEQVAEAISQGATELQDVHDQACDEYYNMVECFWLHEADNECEREALEQCIDDDIEEGLFEPEMTIEEFSQMKEEEGRDLDDEELVEEYHFYLMDDYAAWVHCQDDNEFVACRVGCDLDGIRDEPASYTLKY